MSRDSILARGRTMAEAGMRDTCTIRRVTSTTTDDFSGNVTPTYATLYTGKCRVQQSTPTATRVDAGQDSVLLLALTVQLPMSATGLQVGDQITIDTSIDPDLTGRVFLVESLAHKTDATARARRSQGAHLMTTTTAVPQRICLICSAVADEEPALDKWARVVLPDPVLVRSTFTNDRDAPVIPADNYWLCPPCEAWRPAAATAPLPTAVQELVDRLAVMVEQPDTRRAFIEDQAGMYRLVASHLVIGDAG